MKKSDMFTKPPYGANFIEPHELLELHEVLRERILFRYQREGESNSQKFEKEFSARLGIDHTLSTPNCTSALRLALLTTRPRMGERVAIPSVSFIATAGAVLSCGLIPVLVPVDERLCMDITKIPKDIERVIVVHLDGFSCQIPSDKIVIEDCAQAIGARREDGSYFGTGVHAAAFSFQHNKLLSSGTGGVFATNDPSIWKLARAYHDHGSSREPGCYPTWSDEAFYGENFIANELVTAVQLQQLRKLDEILEKLSTNYLSLKSAIITNRFWKIIDRRNFDVRNTLRILFESECLRDDCRQAFVQNEVPHWTYDRYLLASHPVFLSKRSIYSDGYPWNFLGRVSAPFLTDTLAADLVKRTIAIQIPPQFSELRMSQLSQTVSKILSALRPSSCVGRTRLNFLDKLV